MEIPNEVILFFVGGIAGFINVIAGGGSAITLPTLIFIGLDTATANGTNRINLMMQNISGIGGFHKKKIRGIKLAVKYALLTIPGAVIGAIFSIRITDEWFERILAIMMIGVVISLFKKQGKHDDAIQEKENPGVWFYVSIFLIGFYGGFIQVGVGLIIMASLFHFLQTTLMRVNFYKLVMVLVYMIPALAVFAFNDKVNWIMGFTLALGSMSGAWIAAHISVKKGDKFIRYVLALVILIMAVKLFL